MSKTALILILSLVAVLILANGLLPFWWVEVGGGVAGAGIGVLATLFGLAVAAVATVFALLIAAVLAIAAGPVAVGITVVVMIVVGIALVLALLAGLLPLLIPVLLVAGIVWLATRRPASPRALPAPPA
jgi:hypothetical protein